MQHRGPMAPGDARREFLEQQPTYWLKRSYQLLRRTVDAELRAYGLTLSQRDVLLALYEEGPLDQGALRDRLGLEQSSVSRLVDGLVRRALVELQTGAVDRRVRLAVLTPEGRDLLLTTPGASELGGTVMVQDMSALERRELVRLLERCVDNLSGHEAARPASRDRG
jgi:MarR family transcriptional regulator, lower aerobic nicotinate degradation pathway regulator